MLKTKKIFVLPIILLIGIASFIFAQPPEDVFAEFDDSSTVSAEAPPSTAVIDSSAITVDTLPSPAIAEDEIPAPVVPVLVVPPVLTTSKDTNDASDTNDALATSDIATTAKPKIAVYVTGSADEVENKVLGTYILEALVRSDRYTAIERSEIFLAEIAKEHVAQRSGAIDDAQISRLGKQSGVQFVCVADVTKAFGGNQISVRVLDVEKAEIVAVGVADGSLKNIADLKKISEDAVNAMLGIEVVREKKIRFGARVAYNNSYVLNYGFDVQVLIVEDYRFDETVVDGEFGSGSGFEFGLVTTFRLTGRLSIESGANFIIRTPSVVTNVAEITEFAVTVPALLRYKIGLSPIYVQGGLQLDIPFSPKLKMSGESAVDFAERSSFEAGVIIGAGYQIIKNLSADIRLTGNVTNFDSDTDHWLLQASLGVSWMF